MRKEKAREFLRMLTDRSSLQVRLPILYTSCSPSILQQQQQQQQHLIKLHHQNQQQVLGALVPGTQPPFSGPWALHTHQPQCWVQGPPDDSCLGFLLRGLLAEPVTERSNRPWLIRRVLWLHEEGLSVRLGCLAVGLLCAGGAGSIPRSISHV